MSFFSSLVMWGSKSSSPCCLLFTAPQSPSRAPPCKSSSSPSHGPVGPQVAVLRILLVIAVARSLQRSSPSECDFEPPLPPPFWGPFVCSTLHLPVGSICLLETLGTPPSESPSSSLLLPEVLVFVLDSFAATCHAALLS